MGILGSTSAIFSRTVRLNKKFSCKTTPTCRRNQSGSTMAKSTPSISTRPDSGTYNRCTNLVKVLLPEPEPERPTIPIISLGWHLKLILFNTGARLGAYLKMTFSNNTCPFISGKVARFGLYPGSEGEFKTSPKRCSEIFAC